MMFDSLYKRGLAAGEAEISSDMMVFRYKDELFEFPGTILLAQHDGKYVVGFGKKCYTARVSVLRKLKEELEKKNG